MELALNNFYENEEQIEKFCYFINESMTLCQIDLNDLHPTHSDFQLQDEIEERICICTLPDGGIFCFGTCVGWADIKGTTFIIDKNHNVQGLPYGYPSLGAAATYFDGYVYAFGGCDVRAKLSLATRFNLSKKGGENLPSMPHFSCYCSCTSFNSNVLVSGWDLDGAYLLDLFSFSYAKIPLQLSASYSKIVCKFNQRAYIADFSGNIYESQILNPFEWNIVGRFDSDPDSGSDFPHSHRAFYKDCMYFSLYTYKILKFDFAKKEILEVTI